MSFAMTRHDANGQHDVVLDTIDARDLVYNRTFMGERFHHRLTNDDVAAYDVLTVGWLNGEVVYNVLPSMRLDRFMDAMNDDFNERLLAFTLVPTDSPLDEAIYDAWSADFNNTMDAACEELGIDA